jgi:putative SOS response-associated peptidase YedK
MCGRYVLAAPEDLSERFTADQLSFAINPTWNAAPSQFLPVIVESAPDHWQIQLMHWGLLPRWKSKKPLPPPINARAESVTEKPMFRNLITHRRCLVPASGFYEWQARGEGEKKQPYFIHVKDEPLIAFAGLWDETKPEDAPDAVKGSFAIVTTSANKEMEKLHHRMPVILERNEEDLWLASDVDIAEAVVPLLDAYPGKRIDAFPVSTRVNSVRNNDASLLEPDKSDKDPEQGSLF